SRHHFPARPRTISSAACLRRRSELARANRWSQTERTLARARPIPLGLRRAFVRVARLPSSLEVAPGRATSGYRTAPLGWHGGRRARRAGACWLSDEAGRQTLCLRQGPRPFC